MTMFRDILRDADPVRHEPHRLDQERERVRRTVVAAAMDAPAPSFGWFRRPIALLATVALIVGLAVVGSRIGSQGSATLQAAVRFEVRLAEVQPAEGLREARVAGPDRTIYLHPEVIVSNGDISQSSVVQGDGPARFGIGVRFNAAGAEKMRRATANHVGRPVAILIDGEVATAPILKAPISASAVISGDYTKADAERIANGIGQR